MPVFARLTAGLAIGATLLACSTGEGGDGDPAMFGGTTAESTGSSAGPSSTTASASASATSAASATSGAGESGGPGDTTADPPGDDSGPGSSSGPPASCGDGVVDLGEQCDDGNDSDLDECTVSCTVPTCTDGLWSGQETDIDCGGPCQVCELCGGCASDDDCVAGTYCGDAGACTLSAEITVDYFLNCGTANENSVVVDGLPDGMYRATALPSGGTVWDPPYTPPTIGWMWIIQCVDQTFTQLRTPAGTYYADADEAFANLIAPTEDIAIAGGQLECYRGDSACQDNHGEVSMSVELLCP